MAYDEEFANRVREIVHGETGVTEKRMFGGGMLVRVDPADTQALLDEPHIGRFEMRGRAMTGWLLVGAEAVSTDDDLRVWVGRGLAYARTLPSK